MKTYLISFWFTTDNNGEQGFGNIAVTSESLPTYGECVKYLEENKIERPHIKHPIVLSVSEIGTEPQPRQEAERE